MTMMITDFSPNFRRSLKKGSVTAIGDRQPKSDRRKTDPVTDANFYNTVFYLPFVTGDHNFNTNSNLYRKYLIRIFYV